jgi:hypothetical protein
MESAKQTRMAGASTDGDDTTPTSRPSAHRTTPEIPEWRLLVTDRGADGTMPMTGLFLQVVSSILLVIVFIGGLYYYLRFGEVTFQQTFLVVLVLCALPLSVWTVGKRMRRKGAVEILQEDTRPPILLLRSFAADGTQSSRTIEPILEWSLTNFGPLIAIGRPGEKIPPLGAARFWVGDEHWQLAITKLVPLCQLVVLVLGKASARSGLAWEVEQMLLNQTPKLLWIVIPPKDEEWIRRRWAEYQGLVGERFPEYVPGAVLIAFRPMSLIVFPVKKSWLRGYVREVGTYQNVFTAALAAT